MSLRGRDRERRRTVLQEIPEPALQVAVNDRRAGPQHPLTPAANVASAPRRVLVPRGLPWLGIGLRLFLPDLLAGLVAMLAREWDCVAAAVLQSTDEAYLEADTTRLAAKVGGCVRRVPVEDFQKVKAGELLVEVVDLSFRCCLLTT
jgi:membrane fusion protein, multidrug efflux system